MADPKEGKSGKPAPTGGGEKPEVSMEKRLLLAFALMGIVLLGSQYLMKPPPGAQKAPQQAKKAAEEPKAQQPASPAPAAPAAAAKAPAAAKPKPTAPLAADTVERNDLVVETPLYRVVFTNRGATVRSWQLKKYRDSNGRLVDLVSLAGEQKAGRPLAFHFRGRKPSADLNSALFQVSQPNPHRIEFVYSDGRTSARKILDFDAVRYRAQLSSEVKEAEERVPHLLQWRGGFGDRTAHNAIGTMHSVHYDSAASKLVVEEAKIAEDGPVSLRGTFGFAGIEDTFFAAVILPEPGQTTDFQTWNDSFSPAPGVEETPHVGVAFGGDDGVSAAFFVGPKDLDTLRATHPRLELLVDWGWFSFLAKPLFLFTHWLNDVLTHNWGWAIVVVTIIINTLLLPLRFTSMRSGQKMAKLQPRIQAINEKYKGISMKDPRKQQQNQELMELYKKEGINPLGGCIPLLLQMPFFIAFFKVLSVAIELRGASWLWVADLSQPEASLIRWLPVLMLVTQVAMSKMTPPAGGDPTQQKMMMTLMPIMLTVMFWSASSGLVLYWLTGNVVGIVQQFFFNKLAPVTAPVQAASPKKK